MKQVETIRFENDELQKFAFFFLSSWRKIKGERTLNIYIVT